MYLNLELEVAVWSGAPTDALFIVFDIYLKYKGQDLLYFSIFRENAWVKRDQQDRCGIIMNLRKWIIEGSFLKWSFAIPHTYKQVYPKVIT